MALPDDIRSLRDQVLADLEAAHDYYTDTKIAWRVVQQVIAAGRIITTTNTTTQAITSHAELATKSRAYIRLQLAEATFQQFISIFESFYFDLLRLWLTAYPRNLGGKTIDFKTVLELPDKEAITAFVVGKELNEVLYKRPTEWFAYLEDRAKLGCPTADEVERIAEAKATRDALVHNKGIANKSYELKAGKLARGREGERIDIPERYHREIWELLRKVVAEVANAAITKSS